jgi:hypothetical protein
MEVKIKVNKIVGFKSSVSGTGEKYNMTGNVNVDNGTMTNIEGGIVKDGDGNQVASFTYYGNLNIAYSTNDSTVMTAVITDITAFIDYCKTNAASLNTVETA